MAYSPRLKIRRIPRQRQQEINQTRQAPLLWPQLASCKGSCCCCKSPPPITRLESRLSTTREQRRAENISNIKHPACILFPTDSSRILYPVPWPSPDSFANPARPLRRPIPASNPSPPLSEYSWCRFLSDSYLRRLAF